MTYNSPDATEISQLIASMMPDSEPVHQSNRGLDHGAWVPLRIMYPDADIPVVQMSMPTSDPAKLLELGKRYLPVLQHGAVLGRTHA